MNPLDPLFLTLAATSARASILILAVLALRPVARRYLPARAIFWLWIAVAVRLLWPWALAATWSPFAWQPFSAPGVAHRTALASGSATTSPSSAAPAAPARATSPALSPSGPASRTPLAQLSSQLSSSSVLAWAALVWGAGVLALLVARLIAWVRFVRALERSRVAPGVREAALLATAQEPFGAAALPVVFTSAVGAPALHGIFRPRLLLPPGFVENLSPSGLRFVLAHEHAHAQRRDLLARAALHTAAVLHWFNPLAWLAVHLAREDCELACDECALRDFAAPDREAYGTTLLKIVSLANHASPPRFGLGVVESKQQLKRRIAMIAVPPASSRARTLSAAALFAALTGLTLTRETAAQDLSSPSTTTAPQPAREVAPLQPPETTAADLADDGLDAAFPNGIVASVGDRSVTVADVRREMTPLLGQLHQSAPQPDDFKRKFARLQNDVIGNLVERLVLLRKFGTPAPGEQPRSIPDEYIDRTIADIVQNTFGNDRARFLAYLQDRNLTLDAFRKEQADDIAVHYMQSRLRDPNAKPAAAPEPKAGSVHLRIIQLKSDAGNNSDDARVALIERANAVRARLDAGEKFEDVAREVSQDSRASRGGDWGWMAPGEIKAAYADQIFTLRKGDVSGPLIVKEGAFLFYAEDRR